MASLVAGSIGAALLALIACRRPTLALPLWVASCVLLCEYALFPDAASHPVRLSQLLLAGLLAGFGMAWLLGVARPALPGRPELVMVAFMGWAVASGCISGTILREDGAENVRVLLSGFLIPALVLYLVRSTRQSLPSLRAACAVLHVLLAYLIVTACCEHFRISWLVFPRYILDPSIGIHADKARGPVLNAAENGGIIAILLIVALHRVRYSVGPPARWLATVALLTAGLPALWFTQERGPWLAFAGGLVVVLLYERRTGVAPALAMIAAVAIPLTTVLHLQLIPHRSETIEFRLGLYRESLAAFEEHPITGWGVGTFTDQRHLFGAYGGSTSLAEGVEHDTTVAIATDTGAIGAILYISFIVGLLRSLLRLRGSARSPERRDFYTTCVAALTVFVMNGVFADSRFFMPQNVLVFFLAGLGLGIRPDSQVRSFASRQANRRRFLRYGPPRHYGCAPHLQQGPDAQ